MLYYFGLAALTYLLTRKIVQSKMIYITKDIIYDLRIQIINKVFSTSYEKFEKIDRGIVYSVMDDDISSIGQSAGTFIGITTNIITSFGAFVYMAVLDLWITLMTVSLIAVILCIYYIVSNRTVVLFNEARDTKTVYLRLLNGMIDGFKELSISENKKKSYKVDFEVSTEEFRDKSTRANIKFVNAFLVGESLLIALLGTTAFAIPELFPDVQTGLLMSFVVILLYLIGPINGIFNAIPQLIHLQIAWNRIQRFIDEITPKVDVSVSKKVKSNTKILDALSVSSLKYQYENGFSVGPIDLEIKKGEALFIVGGNGSGKTTLSRLLTGLYTAQEGSIFIDNKKIESEDIGELYSAVFNPFHLFQKMHNVDTNKKGEVDKLLKILRLEDKVSIENDTFSTISLSGGQLKRLALLQCYLEDKPIYLFDEWAADQDPTYRKYFYRELLPKMKKEGKIIIVISHDDQYFDVADKILKLDFGKGKYIKQKDIMLDNTFSQI